MYKIPFNKPFIVGRELEYIEKVVKEGKISGNGPFTAKVHRFFEERYGFGKCLMTTSCTDALEMAALLLQIGEGDEVIVPSFTFVSTANAFVLRGAKIIFADSLPEHPNMDVSKIEALITSRTKAIVAVHYAGHALNMDALLSLSNKYNIPIVEDAAQAIEGTFRNLPLGGFGDLACFSFHETKNLNCGEGGLLVINKPELRDRAEIIWEKGTNRAAFGRGEVNKYNWVDIGSSFLPSELNAAYLYAQLERIDDIQQARMNIWNRYFQALKPLQEEGELILPSLSEYASNNAHLFYILLNSEKERDALIGFLKDSGVLAVFHYLALHNSPFYSAKHDGRKLPHACAFTDRLLRLPLFFGLTDDEQAHVIKLVLKFFNREYDG